MKKQIILAALTIATSLSAFGQGFVLFSATKSTGAWYAPNSNPTNALAQLGNNGISVGFLWGTTGTPLLGLTGSSVSNNVPADWNNALTDPNYHFAQNLGAGNALVVQGVNNSGVAQGGWAYNGGAAFTLTGVPGGTLIQVLAVGWSSAFATPAAAAAAGSFLGWGNTIAYTAGTTGSTTSFAAAGSQAFGVQPVPEPATFALAGLGMAAMLIARRRK